MTNTRKYIRYIISKRDKCENAELYDYVKKLNKNRYNIENINDLLESNDFKTKFSIFAKLHTWVMDNNIKPVKNCFLNGVLIYSPDYNPRCMFLCGQESGIIFQELYSKRTKKVIAHIILEGRYDELIHSLEEQVITNV
jgi:hypothetical protein